MEKYQSVSVLVLLLAIRTVCTSFSGGNLVGTFECYEWAPSPQRYCRQVVFVFLKLQFVLFWFVWGMGYVLNASALFHGQWKGNFKSKWLISLLTVCK
ncbi:hypothetical protein XENTR_v10022771 [Xenopus tropicalis]|nr:hypothetical protein XENTR_v10022771 [Xenopus tropicalis]